MGEGEETLLELVKKIRDKKPTHLIHGMFTKQKGVIYKNSLRPPIQAEDLVNIDNDYSSDYILLKDKLYPIDYKILKKYLTEDYMTLTSFGCPYSCSYCINNKLKELYGPKVRFRKVDEVINELTSVKNKMKFIRHISFDDDAFILRDLEGLKEFAKKYKENVNLPFFVSGVNPMLISEEKMVVLLSAGMDRVRMGIQSGSVKAKAIYHRYIPNDRIINATKIINKYKNRLLLTAYDLILDNPFESKEDVIETIKLLSELPAPFTLNLFSLTFYPGTDIYREAKAMGFIKDDVKEVYKKHYHTISVNYLNFIILLYTIHKIPNWMLNLLLKKSIVNKDIRIPKILFKFTTLVGHARRGINFLLNGDPYTLKRLLRTMF